MCERAQTNLWQMWLLNTWCAVYTGKFYTYIVRVVELQHTTINGIGLFVCRVYYSMQRRWIVIKTITVWMSNWTYHDMASLKKTLFSFVPYWNLKQQHTTIFFFRSNFIRYNACMRDTFLSIESSFIKYIYSNF